MKPAPCRSGSRALASILAAAFSLPVSWAQAPAQTAGDADGAIRLERFRNALIDQALDAPVRVTSSAWLDESGQLRHVSRFFSEVRARAAADALFQAGAAGEAAGVSPGATPAAIAAAPAIPATATAMGPATAHATAPAAPPPAAAVPTAASVSQPATRSVGPSAGAAAPAGGAFAPSAGSVAATPSRAGAAPSGGITAASSDSSTVAVPLADAAKPQAPMSLAATALGSPSLGTSSPASGGSSVAGSPAVPPSGDSQGATSPELCRVGGADLARLAVLDSTVRPLDGARGHAVLLEVERYFHRLLAERARSGAVRLVAIEPVTADSYTRLVAGTGQLDAPYRIELTIQSDRLDQALQGPGSQPGQSPARQAVWATVRAATYIPIPPVSRMPDRRVDVMMTLSDQFNASVLLRREWSFVIPGGSPSIESAVVPDSTLDEIRRSALAWWAEALEKLRCQPVMVRAATSPLGSVSIPVGARSGVRVGDRWAVADPAKIPSRILEPGSLDRALLAEVVSVGPYRSVLRLTSDPGTARALFSVEKGASWFATPL